MILSALGYIADAVVLGTYAALALVKLNVRWFHLANGLCWPPVLAGELIAHAWTAVPLTAVFGAAGLVGFVLDVRKRRRRAADPFAAGDRMVQAPVEFGGVRLPPLSPEFRRYLKRVHGGGMGGDRTGVDGW